MITADLARITIRGSPADLRPRKHPSVTGHTCTCIDPLISLEAQNLAYYPTSVRNSAPLNLSVAAALVMQELFHLCPEAVGATTPEERHELRKKWFTQALKRKNAARVRETETGTEAASDANDAQSPESRWLASSRRCLKNAPPRRARRRRRTSPTRPSPCATCAAQTSTGRRSWGARRASGTRSTGSPTAHEVAIRVRMTAGVFARARPPTAPWRP